MTLYTERVVDGYNVCGYDVVATYDVRKHTAYAILFREIQYKKTDILAF